MHRANVTALRSRASVDEPALPEVLHQPRGRHVDDRDRSRSRRLAERRTRIARIDVNWLLCFVPLAVIVEHLAPDRYLLVFLVSGLAIVPLAGVMGHATEQLAERTGEGV